MKKRITWKENDLVSLQLRDDLFTIAQMLRSPYMRFFKTSNRDGEWHDLDLNTAEVLFDGLVGNVVLQELAAGRVKDATVRPSMASCQKLWLRPKLHFGGGYPFRGADLVEVDPNVGYTKAPIVKPSVSRETDPDLVEQLELTNMWGADDLRQRLSTYFDTGRDENPLKTKVFPLG